MRFSLPSAKFSMILFVLVFSILTFFSSGTVESEDGWLYLTVARNFYYHGQLRPAPNEYDQRLNVHMNSIKKLDGQWIIRNGKGYALSFVPAVAISDLYHRATGIPVPERFPLETDWSLLFVASFVNSVWAAILFVVMFWYGKALRFSSRWSLFLSCSTIFLSNLFPLAKFGFAHLLFTTLLIIGFLAIKKFSQSKNVFWLGILFCSSICLMFAYNISFVLGFFGLAVYFLLLNWKTVDWRKIILPVGVVAMVGGLFFGKYIFETVVYSLKFHEKVLFEGLWGFLFSPGKSIFLYSPMLLVLPVFWFKLSRKYRSEIVAFGILSGLFLLFYSMSHLDEGTRGIFPIWYGGAVWGPRYLAPILPLATVLVTTIIQALSKWQRRLIIIPLVFASLGIQLVGTLNPYQVQYRGLPYNIFIGEHEILQYEYASFIPRFSPILTMVKELAVKTYRLPGTLQHGEYQARLYDGFTLPVKTANGVARGVLSTAALSFYQREGNETILSFTFLPYPEKAELIFSTPQAGKILITQLARDQEQTVTVRIPTQDTQQFVRIVRVTESENSEPVLLSSLAINTKPVNLRTLDFPFLDANQPNPRPLYPPVHYGVEMKNPWELWRLRNGIYESSFDLWWVRAFYYWDIPQRSLVIVWMTFVSTLVISGSLFIKSENFRDMIKEAKGKL